MSKTRVVVTGLGLVCPLGVRLGEVWQGLLAGRSGIRKISSFDTTGFDVTFAGEVPNFNPGEWIEEREAKRMDRFAQLAVAAASQAVQDAGLDFTKLDRDRCGVILGSGIGGLKELEDQNRRLIEKGPSRISPFYIPKLMANAAPGHISMKFGLRGPNFSTASACASANHALGSALRTIQYGDADLIVTGGTEATVTPSGVGGFAALKALSTRNDAPEKASRPFDKDRDGFVLGEGSGVLIFESLEHATRRGARILAEVLGFGQSADAFHITAPDEDGGGAILSLSKAMKDAGVHPEQVSYINAHGTSTPLNDKIETLSIKKVFGELAYRIPINSTKSMIGHLLGAAGGAEAVVCVLSIRDDVVHPTINRETPDPECDLDYVTTGARKLPVNVAMSNSLGFGGHNSTIVFGKCRA